MGHRYFSIPRLKEAIEHLEKFNSKWVLIPLVFAVNGVNESEDTNVQEDGKPGTDGFLEKHFNGSLIGLPDFPNGGNTLRPRFAEIHAEPDFVLHQKMKRLWGNSYSQIGYSTMVDKGLVVSSGRSRFKLTPDFAKAWSSHLPGDFRFEQLLVWLYGFSGFDEEIGDWESLSTRFQEDHLGKGEKFPAAYEGRFRISGDVAWPSDLLTARPTDEELQAELRATGHVKWKRPGEIPTQLGDLRREVERKGQIILQGPPGTGKTHLALEYVRWLSGGEPEKTRLTGHMQAIPPGDRSVEAVAAAVVEYGVPVLWEIVQFHPSYTYEDFVRGIEAKPVAAGESSDLHQLSFHAVDKALGWMASVAQELANRDLDVPVVLVIDEINRGDISKIFGELIFALEYREHPIATPYEIDGDSTLTLPGNLFLVGTMNTADRSIAMVDYALRRRFAFLDLRPDRKVIEGANGFLGADRDAALTLFDKTAELFPAGTELSDLQIGHSYFLPDGLATSETEALASIARRFAHEVLPLLLEYELEGRFEQGELGSLLQALGWGEATVPTQPQLAEHLASWLEALPDA